MTPCTMVSKNFGSQAALKKHLRALAKELRKPCPPYLGCSLPNRAVMRSVSALTHPAVDDLKLLGVWDRWSFLQVVITDNSRPVGDNKRSRRVFRDSLFLEEPELAKRIRDGEAEIAAQFAETEGGQGA
jgi:hypothetical protein